MRIAFLLPLAGLAACQTALEGAATPLGAAIIRNEAGVEIGTVRLFGQGEALSINVVLQLPGESGLRGMHLHEVGDCTAAGFTSAGSHLNPGGNQHGLANAAGPHLGDLPNIQLSSAGTGTVSAIIAGDRAGALGHLFDADGTAIVVHAAADDNVSDPSGNSGRRIACGVFEAG